jgi:hypothetical protein
MKRLGIANGEFTAWSVAMRRDKFSNRRIARVTTRQAKKGTAIRHPI